MKRNRLGMRFVSAAASIAIALSAAAQLCITPVSAADTYTATGNYIQNGSFEAPKVSDVAKNYGDLITENVNAGNEISYRNKGWMVTSETTFNTVSNNQFYWHTTASDSRIEIVKADETGDGTYFPANEQKAAAHGEQFAELVAEEESSLYQNINTTPGSTLTWSISHRARVETTSNDKNSIAVFVGPEQVDLKKREDDQNDIFKQMAMLMYTNIDNLPVGKSERAYKLYSVPMTNDRTEPITSASVSTVKSDKHSVEWFCWIITSDTEKWYEYADTYEVPDEQIETTLAFAALNGGKDDQDYINAGNLIDDVRFGIMYPLDVSTMPGGTGHIQYENDDIMSDYQVTDDSPFMMNLEENTNVTIKAVPNTTDENNRYKFMGALIDGTIVNVNETSVFTQVEGEKGSYSFDLTMNQAHHVVLFFALTGKVTYAPNGGKFEGAESDYVGEKPVDNGAQKVYTSTDNWSLTQTNAPENSGKSFVGWRVVADGRVYFVDGVKLTPYNNEFIPQAHDVNCEANEDSKTFTYTITYYDGNDKKTLKAELSDRTLLFEAEYLNRLIVQPCYTGVDGVTVHGDKAGGDATVTAGTSNDVKSVDLYVGQEYTLEAVAKTGYEFKGWYYAYESDLDNIKLITNARTPHTARFSSNENVIIHANFVEKATTPEVAVIAQDDVAKEVLEAKGIKNTITNFDDGYGENVYGNTISTSFTLTRDFSGYTTDVSGVWTVVLPTLGTYMKVSENDGVDYQYINKSDPVVEDVNVENNSGTIYGTKEGLNTTEQFQFYVESGTTLSGGNVIFGLVIDNVYAPKATAGFKVTSSMPVNVKKLDDSNSIYTNYGSGKSYKHDEDKLNGSTNGAGE